MSDVLDNFQKKARDHARTPMQVGIIPKHHVVCQVSFTLSLSGTHLNTRALPPAHLGCGSMMIMPKLGTRKLRSKMMPAYGVSGRRRLPPERLRMFWLVPTSFPGYL